MGSKHRLLPWIESVLSELDFATALDAFSGSGCVSYLLKTMGKQVHSNDFLRFATDFTRATVENSDELLSEADVLRLVDESAPHDRRIEQLFEGIFFDKSDLRFLDQVWTHIPTLSGPKRALTLAALYRACLKKQPRGVFTVSGGRYDDGRRDLRLSLRDHFIESVELFNGLVFDNGHTHRVTCSDVYEVSTATAPDLVYLDPPYVPRTDDNCYIKRYHFLEGLSTYWEGADFHPTSKVKKLQKRFTPFSYRRFAEDAFARLFERYSESIVVLSYSSNGYPDLPRLVELLSRYKTNVDVHTAEHRYHFGTHAAASEERRSVTEYLIIGT